MHLKARFYLKLVLEHTKLTFVRMARQSITISGPDPGFSVGAGGPGPILGEFWPPTWALLSENVCENERIGSCRGNMHRHARLDLPMHLSKWNVCTKCKYILRYYTIYSHVRGI